MHEKDRIKLENIGIETGPLFLKGFKHDEKEALPAFLHNFLGVYNQKYDTVFADNTLQTIAQRSRSLGDIFRVCLSYYPDVRLQEVKKALIGLGSGLVGHYCGDIERRVYEAASVQQRWRQQGIDDNDEFGDAIEYQITSEDG